MQAKDVANLLNHAFNDGDYGRGPWSAIRYELDATPVALGSSASVSLVDAYGGEGEGDRAYTVIKVASADGDQFFRKDGYYASYDGFTWDGDFYEVTPKQKIVTIYEDAIRTNVFDGYEAFDSFDEDDSFL